MTYSRSASRPLGYLVRRVPSALPFLLALALLVRTSSTVCAQELSIDRVDPPHWWTGMGRDTVELLVEGRGLDSAALRLDAKGVRIIRQQPASNRRYVYLTLYIDADAPPQTLQLRASKRSATARRAWELRAREGSKHKLIGLDSRDLAYLIMTDRFANGDTANDVIAGMRENTVNRAVPTARHGGDIAGIRRHLVDISVLGATALWMCPLLENDQPHASYHGYAITDHYAIDPRFGTNKDYCELVREAHALNMRVVMDVVYNHTGSMHRLVTSPPDSSWFHWWPQYTQTNFREMTLYDPHAAPADLKRFTDGWFDSAMPDVNAKDPHCALYLLQNTLWWIEEADVDALRIDTYTYPDQSFMAWLNAEVQRVFPGIFLFGETWVDSHASQAYFLKDFRYGANTHLPGSTDFQVHFALLDVLGKTSGWDSGVGRLYRVLAADYLYVDPMKEVIFLDNHDTPRILGVVNNDMKRFALGYSLLLTLRGIPCITYGSEAAFADVREHGTIRQDMPGGWPGDTRSVWNPSQRTAREQECFDFISSLASYRRGSRALTQGALMHITPENGVYGYVRYIEDESVLVVVNADTVQRSVAIRRFDDVLGGQRLASEVPSLAPVQLPELLTLEPLSTRIYELRRPKPRE